MLHTSPCELKVYEFPAHAADKKLWLLMLIHDNLEVRRPNMGMYSKRENMIFRFDFDNIFISGRELGFYPWYPNNLENNTD